MNGKNYRLSEGMVDRYLELSNMINAHGYTADNVGTLAELCHDAVKFIAQMRCEYSQLIVRRRRARQERIRSNIFNCK